VVLRRRRNGRSTGTKTRHYWKDGRVNTTGSLPWFQEERRETNEAHESRVVVRRQMDGTVVDRVVSDGHKSRNCGPRGGNQHDDGPGDGVSGERSAWHRNTGGELAIFYNGERTVSGGR